MVFNTLFTISSACCGLPSITSTMSILKRKYFLIISIRWQWSFSCCTAVKAGDTAILVLSAILFYSHKSIAKGLHFFLQQYRFYVIFMQFLIAAISCFPRKFWVYWLYCNDFYISFRIGSMEIAFHSCIKNSSVLTHSLIHSEWLFWKWFLLCFISTLGLLSFSIIVRGVNCDIFRVLLIQIWMKARFDYVSNLLTLYL
jgi:hypothetical protein